MNFTKMHGIGNDYIYIFGETDVDMKVFAEKYSSRHTGIGSDGVIHITLSETHDFKMTMYNADGSLGAMCGNGIRCLGKYVYDQGLTGKTELSIETSAGSRYLTLHLGENQLVQSVTVDMGEVEEMRELTVDLDGKEITGTYVNVGNPHFVVLCENPNLIPLDNWGKKLEKHPCFAPDGVNVEFVVPQEDGFYFRVWERGSGETQACGTGACACYAVISKLLHGEEKILTSKLLGGTLKLWSDQGHLFMEGDAVCVYHGEIPLRDCLA